MSPHIYTMSDRWPLHLKEDHEVISILRSLLTDNSPKPGKVGQTTGVFVPYPFRIMVWVLLRPTRTRSGKVLWDGTYGFSSLSEKKTESLNHLQMSLQRNYFLLSYLKTLSFGPAGVWTRDLPLSRLAPSQLTQSWCPYWPGSTVTSHLEANCLAWGRGRWAVFQNLITIKTYNVSHFPYPMDNSKTVYVLYPAK